MLLELLGAVLGAVMVAGYLLWTRHYGYWARRGVPSLRPNFPFGNIKDVLLMRQTIGQAYDRIYKQFEGCPYVGFYKLRQPILMVRDPELVKTVLIKEFNNFHDNDYYVNPAVDPILGLNPFNAKGDKWKSARGVVTPSLTVTKVKPLVPQIIKVCGKLLDYLRENEDTPLELYELAGKYTTDVVMMCAYGVELNSFKDPDSEFRQMSRNIFEGGFRSNAAVLFAFYAPKLGEIFKFKILSQKVEQFFITLVKTIVQHRTKNGVKGEDFIQSLISQQTADKNGENDKPVYNYVEMAAHCMTFFLDGFETAAILIGYTLYELALNPEVQERLRQEIVKTSPDYTSFTFDTIHGIGYLDRVISESLRKHPPGTTTTRVCNGRVRLEGRDGGTPLEVEEGTPVVLPMYSIHNDPRHFPEPHRFNPDRFTESSKATRHPYAYFPFGAGPRTCPGFRFALSMVKMSIITAVLNYRLEPREHVPTEQLELDPMNTFFHTAKDGLWIKFERLDTSRKQGASI